MGIHGGLKIKMWEIEYEIATSAIGRLAMTNTKKQRKNTKDVGINGRSHWPLVDII